MVNKKMKEFPGYLKVGTDEEYSYVWLAMEFIQLRSKKEVREVAKGLEEAAKLLRKTVKSNKVIKNEDH